MVFSLFEESKPMHKIQLKNCTKVVIGSRTDIEHAFQIGNFMNMLFHRIIERNFENCFVAIHNLSFSLSQLINYCVHKVEDINASYGYEYEFHRKEFEIRIEALSDELILLRSLESTKNNFPKDKIDENIRLSVESLNGKYVQLAYEIVHVFPDYFELIEEKES
jgi:hypothetical protein